MAIFRRPDDVHWNELNMQEQLVMFAMTEAPQKYVEWAVQRRLCHLRVAEITGRGLKLTRAGRLVMAERHGLPIVVGRDPEALPAASSAL